MNSTSCCSDLLLSSAALLPSDEPVPPTRALDGLYPLDLGGSALPPERGPPVLRLTNSTTQESVKTRLLSMEMMLHYSSFLTSYG